MGLSIGILNVGLGVLCEPDSAIGWKCIATLECLLGLVFPAWFMHVGRTFKRDNEWLPLGIYLLTNKNGLCIRFNIFFLSACVYFPFII